PDSPSSFGRGDNDVEVGDVAVGVEELEAEVARADEAARAVDRAPPPGLLPVDLLPEALPPSRIRRDRLFRRALLVASRAQLVELLEVGLGRGVRVPSLDRDRGLGR